MVFGAVGLVTRVAEKVVMTLTTTSRGFQTSRVSLQEIRAGFLATGPAKVFVWCTDAFPLCYRVSNSGHTRNWTQKIPANA